MTFCLWITGLPGSGKSTIQEGLEKMLSRAGIESITLAMDRIRRFVTPDPKYTEEEREIVYRSLVLVAGLLKTHSGKSILIDATGNRRKFRDLARKRIDGFAEVYVECPPELCRSREKARHAGYVEQDLYNKAETGQLQGDMPGVSAPYEEPVNPEVTVQSDRMSPGESAEKIMDFIRETWLKD